MSPSLLDTNVLVALLWKPHSHYTAAWRWFHQDRGRGWATCPFTQAGFVRIVSTPRLFPNAPPPSQAMKLLGEFIESNSHHSFWPDSLPVVGIDAALCSRITGHKQLNDAYLLALAIHHKARLVTFDQGVLALAPPRTAEHASLVILQQP